MTIKGLVSNILPSEVRQKLNVQKKEHAESSADREPQKESGDSSPEKKKMTNEEILAAMEHLRQLPGIKDNNLQVRVSEKDGIHVVYIEDIKGQVVRRIPESELALLTKDKDKKKGHILDRAM
jgi:uncharacterized FlaG/YvyC family protein